jgi:hypothetical protein
MWRRRRSEYSRLGDTYGNGSLTERNNGSVRRISHLTHAERREHPSSVNSRLTQGECVPVSRAMRLRGILAKVCFIPSGVVGSFCWCQRRYPDTGWRRPVRSRRYHRQKEDLPDRDRHTETLRNQEILPSSVAEEIFRQVSCPVLNVRPHVSLALVPDGGPRKILYATDFRQESELAASCAVSLAQQLHASLTLTHAVANPGVGELVNPAQLENHYLEQLQSGAARSGGLVQGGICCQTG